jgi:hypothetical protein
MRLDRWPLVPRLVVAMCSLLMLSHPLAAQGAGAPGSDTAQSSAVRAYLDCQEWGCDRDFR